MKKTLLKVVSYVLVAALAIGGTVAFLQDSDSDVNVMTLGNVKIEQHEYEREVDANGSYATKTIDGVTSYVLKDFTQGKPLLPIVGDPNEPGGSPAYAGYDSTTVRMTQVGSYGGMQVFAGKNAQDKFVTVENTGKSDAYVRTLVAIECGTGNTALIGTGDRCVAADEAASSTMPWIEYEIGKIVIDNNTYLLREYVYRGASDVNRHVNGVLPAGDTTYPNLCQVYLKHNATNEDMVAIDGNGNGTLDILVFSQAVQAAGFANAEEALNAGFGDITAANHPWSETSLEAPAIINKVATLDNDVIIFDASELNTMDQNGFTFNGNGNTITVQDAEGKIDETGTIPLSAVVFSSERGGEAVVVNDVTVTGTLQMVTAGNYVASKAKRTDFNTTFNNVNVVDCELIYFSNNGFTSALTAYGTLAMNNCKVTGNKISASSSVDAPVYDMAAVNQTNVTIKNSEIGSMRVWNQAWVAIYDSEVDTIDSAAITTKDLGKLVIGAGTHVNTINLIPGKYTPAITIEAGATVGTINYNGVSYTQAEWLARP